MAMSTRLSFTIHELVNELDRYADRALRRDYGVGFNQFHFLAVLADVGPADMSTLAACMGVTRAAVSKRTPAMVADGWVTARSEPGAGRSVTLALTERGVELVETAGGDLERALTRRFDELAAAGTRIDPDLLNTQLNAITTLFREKGTEEA